MLNLTIPLEASQHLSCISPASARHNQALVNNLLGVVNDMLRSPGLTATVCGRAAEIHKPLPSRPRSVSLPPTPVELPGSILLENQGFPVSSAVGPFPHRPTTMRTARSGTSLSSAARSTPQRGPQHRKSMSEVGLQRRTKSRPKLNVSPSSTDNKLATCPESTVGEQAKRREPAKTRGEVEKTALEPSPLIVEAKTSGEVSSTSPSEASNHSCLACHALPCLALPLLVNNPSAAPDNLFAYLCNA